MIIRTAVVIATLMIVITKNDKNYIDSRNENSRSENSNSSYNSTTVRLITILVNSVYNSSIMQAPFPDVAL